VSGETLQKMIKSYVDGGKGLKAIAREIGISYTATRRILLKEAGIKLRKSNDVTDFLRQVRSENLKKRIKKHGPYKTQRKGKDRFGIQGWYWNKGRKKWVWLRSAWEYICACWLDRNGKDWDVEVYQSKIDDVWYRPDFFIYECGVLKKVIEIKSDYVQSLQKDRRDSLPSLFDGVPIERFLSIEPFLPKLSSYGLELSAWKKIARSNKKIKEIDAVAENKERKKQNKRDILKKKDFLREKRTCPCCSSDFIVLKSQYRVTCGKSSCLRQIRETVGKKIMLKYEAIRKDQKQKIIHLYLKSGVGLIGQNGRKSLAPLYPVLKRNGLPVHEYTLRKIFKVGSLYDIVDILEGKYGVPTS
jgi:transposase-like protein/ribosomal protein S27AE